MRSRGRHNWARDEFVWAIWGLSEPEVQMLPDDVDGFDAM